MKRIVAFFLAIAICLSLATMAAAAVNFVPSITAKPAPEVVMPPAAVVPPSASEPSSDGEPADAETTPEAEAEAPVYALVIKDEKESVVSSSKTAVLIVTSVAEVMKETPAETTPSKDQQGTQSKDEQSQETIAEETQPEETMPKLSEERAAALKEAYETLSAKNVSLTKVVDGLDKVVKEQKVNASKLVVKDLFDIRLSEESFEEDLNVEGHTIDVAFKADLKPGQFVTIAVFKDGKWILAEKVLVGEDGIITATLECLGAVAIIVGE